jgi:iron complex outermembrane receptor protein
MKTSLGGLLAAIFAGSTLAAGVTEADYFADLPVVLSVSRLAQPQSDVPGAVTIIDQEMIRRSGAREVADVLRLVPGFIMTRWQAGLVSTYHAGMDIYGARMQVYVDGRSVYSSHFLGDTHFGLRGLVLEDIQRIEVLRGSNSASYGSNAYMGVVNIITRHAADTQGAMASLTRGTDGIDDAVARIDWGRPEASFRVTASRRKDSGIDNSPDDGAQWRVGFRGDLELSPRDTVLLEAGRGQLEYQFGSFRITNPVRPVRIDDSHILARWQRQIDADRRIELRLTHDTEQFADAFPVRVTLLGQPYTTIVSTSGRADRTEIGAQYQTRFSDSLRGVGGAELRREAATSPALFATAATQVARQSRVFGNLEWHATPTWVLQGGGMHESHNITGSSFSPRLAVNHHVTPNHTLRAVVTKARKSPTLFDQRGDWQFRDLTSGAIIPVQGRSYLADGTVQAETLRSQELGYLGRFRDWGLTVDVRLFEEKISNRLRQGVRSIGSVATFPNYFPSVLKMVNTPGPTLRGVEYQLDWQPVAGTRVLYNEAHLRKTPGTSEDADDVPRRTSAVMWLQALPGGLEGSLSATFSTPVQWEGGASRVSEARRIDLRLGKPFRSGSLRGEVALVAQSVNGGHEIYEPALKQNRRTFITLRFDL